LSIQPRMPTDPKNINSTTNSGALPTPRNARTLSAVGAPPAS
jgi:hypothetical protein